MRNSSIIDGGVVKCRYNVAQQQLSANTSVLLARETTMKSVLVFAIALVALVFAGAAEAQQWDIGAASRMRNEALDAGRVTAAVVVQVRRVEIAPSNARNYVATGLGSAIGAVIGSRAGGGNGRYVAGALGGVLGAIAGNLAGDAMGGTYGQEVIVRTGDGRLLTVTQSQSNLMPGERVYLVQSAGKTRVAPAA